MKTHKFKAGRHRPQGWWKRLFSFQWKRSHEHFEVMFLPNCWYTRESVKHTGINKLLGYSWGLRGPHGNSLRMGWQPDFHTPGRIKLYAYWYAQGAGYYAKYMCSVQEAELFEVNISPITGVLVISAPSLPHNSWFFAMGEGVKASSPITYAHGPYFGGKSAAPQDMGIIIQKQ